MWFRLIGLHHVTSEALTLLTALVDEGILPGDSDIWQLFWPPLAPRSQSAFHFLSSCMLATPLPERHTGFALPPDVNAAYSLRCVLLNWCFPADDDSLGDSPAEALEKALLFSHNLDYNQVSEIVIALVFRDTSAIVTKKHVNVQSPFQCDSLTLLQQIQELYLQSTYNLSPLLNSCAEVDKEKSEDASQACCHISVLQSHLLDSLLERNCGLLLEVPEPDVSPFQMCVFVMVIAYYEFS